MTSSTNAAAASTEAPMAILIPSLTNDVALQCLARVPRRYHPVLAAVSKSIRSVLSSPEFFAVRSALNCTEHLLYFRIRSRDFRPTFWFTLYRRHNPNSASATGNFTMAPVPGILNCFLECFDHAAVGPKIYFLGGITGGHLASTEMLIFDCRFHTWELGPSMPTARKHGVKTVVLDGNIYVFASLTVEGSWADVFDTVAWRWEALPSPELMVYDKLVLGCGIRGGKVCVWMNGEELRFDTATKTWEAFGLVVWQLSPMCLVNGVLYSLNALDESCIVFLDKAGFWQHLNLMNAEFPNHFFIDLMENVGGRLVIMGHGVLPDEIVDSKMEATRMGVWCAEIEGKEMGSLDFCGEVLWSEMVYSYSTSMIHATCLQVSFKIGCKSSTKVWIFDCRFHKWERSPNMPTTRKHGLRMIVLDAKIYVFGSLTSEGSWADMFDTVAGHWEAIPSPELAVYDKLVLGCGIRGGKVCVWVEGEELRFGPVTKTWEVFSLVLPEFSHICEVSGVLCCCYGDIRTLKGFDGRVGLWKEIKLVNGGFPNDFLVLQTLNVGGRSVIVGLGRIGICCAEFEVKQDRDNGDFFGEVLWSDMVYSMHESLLYRLSLFNTCMPVSL